MIAERTKSPVSVVTEQGKDIVMSEETNAHFPAEYQLALPVPCRIR